MAKPILFYCLLRGGYGRGFKVLGVTTEKHRIVYGRDEDDGLTSASVRDVLHRFPEGTPLEFAKDAGKRADAEAERHKVGLQIARAELSWLEDRKAAAVLAAAKGTLVSADTRPVGLLDPEAKRVPRPDAGPNPTRSDEGPAGECWGCGAKDLAQCPTRPRCSEL